MKWLEFVAAWLWFLLKHLTNFAQFQSYLLLPTSGIWILLLLLRNLYELILLGIRAQEQQWLPNIRELLVAKAEQVSI
jgi:hypothetical protein